MVISAVRRAGRPSRTEIAAATGLSHSTISAISSDLIQQRILCETRAGGPASLRRGRPQVALALEPKAATVVAAVLSLNFLSAAVIDYSGAIVAEEQVRLPTRGLARADLLGKCVATMGRLLAGRGAAPQPARIVLAVQGICDAHARRLIWSPITPHRDIPFADAIERELYVPATVETDCNMMALALNLRDPSRYGDNFAAILLSYGIGMGLMLKGELFTGSQSSGGEFGHMIHRPGGALCRCGCRGCIEAYASNYAIWRKALRLSEDCLPEAGIDDADMRALADRARAADGPEREAYRQAGTAMGFGLGSLFALVDPVPVAFVGTGAAALDLLEAEMREALAGTTGGRHAASLRFAAIADELPLIREGCAVRALTFVDQDMFAPGPAAASASQRTEARTTA